MQKLAYETPDVNVILYPAYETIILASPENEEDEGWGPLI